VLNNIQNTIHITHLYPRHMSLYGDRGNIIVLAHKAKSAGIEIVLQNCSVGESINPKCQIMLLGGGQDNDQEIIQNDLLKRQNELSDLIKNGSTFLGICGGFQLLGQSYQTANGQEIQGLGFLNMKTINAKPDEKRIIGNAIVESPVFGKLIGYENHGGRTFLPSELKPLGQIVQGGGNNGQDKSEGVLTQWEKGLILGTYFHGFLPKNPQVANYLIQRFFPNLKILNKSLSLLESMNQANNLKLSY
jgi:lipid II isoglutaminyl synthase (glutamine-hydrolysing)